MSEKKTGTFLYAQLNLENGDNIKTYIRVEDIPNFPKIGIEVVIPTMLDAERIMRFVQSSTSLDLFNKFIREKKIKFEK
jgi:hypothetical protein